MVRRKAWSQVIYFDREKLIYFKQPSMFFMLIISFMLLEKNHMQLAFLKVTSFGSLIFARLICDT